MNQFNNCDALRDLAPFVQFKKREKYPWKSVTFRKVTFSNFTKSNSPPWVFFKFLNCTNSIKSRKASQIVYAVHLYSPLVSNF